LYNDCSCNFFAFRLPAGPLDKEALSVLARQFPISMTIHYLLDSNAVLQTPEVLAEARHCKLLIPKAVLAKLATRGREHIRKVIGALISDALEAGAEVIEAPAHIKCELVASDLIAHRLNSAAMEIARTAIGLTESGQVVCVVTLDRALDVFLASRKICSIAPTAFLEEQKGVAADAALLTSAKSYAAEQNRYLAFNAMVGVLGAVGASTIFFNAAYLLSTISIWGTALALPLLGILLFWYRQRYRLSYGVFEFLVGVMMGYFVFLPSFDFKTLGVIQGLQILGALYVMVRGLDNIGRGIEEGTRLESIWNQIFEPH